MKQTGSAALGLASLTALSLGLSACSGDVAAEPVPKSPSSQQTVSAVQEDGASASSTGGPEDDATSKQGGRVGPSGSDGVQGSGGGDQESGVSAAVQNAMDSATSYLDFQAFSKQGLIRQLSSPAGDGFDKAIATKAVNHLDVSWKTQAVEAAKNYLEFSSFSKAGLIRQLESDAGDGFTHAQAVYGVEKAYGTSKQGGRVGPSGSDGVQGSGGGDQESGVSAAVQNAMDSATSYLDFQAFSKQGLIRQLSSPAGDGFDKAIATKAVNHLDVSWKTQAVEAAKNYLEFSSFSKAGLIRQLESDAGDGFTHAQAVYGVEKAYNNQ